MRAVRTIVSMVAIPGLVAGTLLGASPTGHPTVALSPSAETVVRAVTAHKELPAGTKLTFGERGHVITVSYDDHGRLVATPPHGETFGTMLAKGLGRATGMLSGVANAQSAAQPGAQHVTASSKP